MYGITRINKTIAFFSSRKMAPPILFLLLLFLQKATSNNTTCHNPCLRNSLEVRFPFGFDNNRCSYPGFKLSCDSKTQIITLDLPNIGNFTVRNINYGSQTVTITDPQNCLAKKFIDSSFDLSGSPFNIPEYYNHFFTFLNCSTNSTTVISGIRRVNCLSNENFTVVTLPTNIYESLPDFMPPFCTELKKRVAVPPWYRWSDSETRLIWNEPYCLPCEVDGGTCQFKGNTGLTIDCNGRRSKGMFSEKF